LKLIEIQASKASAATYALGRFLAPHIREKGALALSHFAEQSEEKSHKQVRGYLHISQNLYLRTFCLHLA